MRLSLDPHEFIPRLIKAQKKRMIAKYREYLLEAIGDGYFGENKKRQPESLMDEPLYHIRDAIEKYAGIKIILEEE